MVLYTAEEIERVITLIKAIRSQEGKARRAAARGLDEMAAAHEAEARRCERVLDGIGRRAR